MQRLKYMVYLFLAPQRFIEASTDRIVSLQMRHHQGPYTAEHRAKAEAFARIQAVTLRKTILLGIAVTAMTILLGYLGGLGLRNFGKPQQTWVYLMQAFGAAVILGATLGQIGRKDESMGGENLADEMNVFVFRALYVLGTLVFVASVSWDAT